jgi:phosphotriesterase-related protein
LHFPQIESIHESAHFGLAGYYALYAIIKSVKVVSRLGNRQEETNMKTVNSVLGPINTGELGFTLMHEHVIVAAAGITQDYPELLGERLLDRIVQKLTEVKNAGISTVVDATTLDLGRDINILAQAADRARINIIACTGWWLEAPTFLTGVSINQLTQVFVREIREGISNTGIKAGILKAASDAGGVTEWQEKVLRAVARAYLLTDVPIMLHSCSPKQTGKRQLAILKEEGVKPERVKMDHSNDTTDIEYLTWLLEQGCYLGMDRYPGYNRVDSHERTRTLKALIDAGYIDRLLPSHDWPLAQIRSDAPAAQRPSEREGQRPDGWLHLNKVVFPELRDMGLSESQIERLCVTGPRNFFEGVCK